MEARLYCVPSEIRTWYFSCTSYSRHQFCLCVFTYWRISWLGVRLQTRTHTLLHYLMEKIDGLCDEKEHISAPMQPSPS
jgi:hypothetical protein